MTTYLSRRPSFSYGVNSRSAELHHEWCEPFLTTMLTRLGHERGWLASHAILGSN